jgi:raffinose/stachyose/melibiose transport system substrate-binding protein
MPMYFAPGYIYYNKKMFEEAGVDPQTWANPSEPTWEEFTDAADALKAAGFDPIALGNGDTWPGLWYYWAFQNRYGGNEELFKAINEGGTYQAPSFFKAGEMSQELANRDYLTPNFNSYSGADKYTVFTQGNGAMIYQGTWMLGRILEQAPEDFEFGFFNFPSFSDGNPDSQSDVMAGMDAMWISANSENPEAAAEFLNGFADPERALEFIVKTQNIPAVNGITAPAGQEEEVLWKLTDLTSKATGVFPWWDISALPPAVNEEMMSMGQALLLGEITPEEFTQRMDAAAGR